MLISSQRILEATAQTLRSMSQRRDLPADLIPDCEMMAYLLDQLPRPRDGRTAPEGYWEGDALLTAFSAQGGEADATRQSLRELKDSLLRIFALAPDGDAAANHLDFLQRADGLIAGKIDGGALSGDNCLRIAADLCQWEKRFIVTIAPQTGAANGDSHAFTAEKVQRYFDERFPGAGSVVERVAILPGGYGKQTIMIDVEGGPVPGSLVVRRDLGAPVLDNDCHFVRREYPLLKALHQRGVAVPEALWLERNSPILPGGDFIVTRKVEGQVQGDVLGTAGAIPEALVDELARHVARLHQLPPLTELGGEVASLDASLWNETITTCGRKYIENFYDFFRNTPSIPQPALCAMFGWLINNVPRCDEPPVLVHGDIGFHNFLVKDNRITCLLDWEFAHIGDPAEDIGYIKSALGGKIDWNHFLDLYRRYGGRDIDPQRIVFYQVWGYLRNAVGCALSGYRFERGELDDVKMAVVPYRYIHHYIEKCLGFIGSSDAMSNTANINT